MSLLIVVSFFTALVLFALFYGQLPAAALAVCSISAAAVLCLLGRGHTHTEDGMTRIDACAQSSGLREVNAGLKLLLFSAVLVAAVAAKHMWVAAVIGCTVCLITVWIGKIPVRVFFSLMTVPAAFVLLSSLALLFDVSAEAAGVLSLPLFGRYLVVTQLSQAAAKHVMVKALAATACLYALSLSTPFSELIGVLRKIRVPELVIELMFLIYRYVFVLLRTLSELQTAAAARLGFHGAKATFRSAAGMMGGLLTLSLRRASAAFDAMEARCYDGTLRFFSRESPLTLRHGIHAGTYLLAVVAMLVAERVV